MGQLDLQWQYQPSLSTGIGRAKSNVWSRAARRKQKNIINEATSAKSDEEDDEHAILGFKIQIGAREGGQVIQVRWMQGKDSVLFESFCGMLKRQMIA